MLPLSRPHLLIIGIGAAILASSLPCKADEMTNAEILRRKASIRYTTGYTKTVGWEKGLVDGDSNLGHWHWSPMINYQQGYRKVPAGQSQKTTQLAQRPQGGIYVKPTKVALPQRHYDWSYLKKYQRRTTTDTSVVLTAHQPNNAEPVEAKAYGGGYGDCNAKIRASKDSLANKEVSGRLLK